MVNRVLAWGAAAGVTIGAGVVKQGGDGAGGVAGEGCPDGDLVHVAAVEDLDVERGQQGFADAGRGVGEQPDDDGQQVEQGQVIIGRGSGLEGFELGFGAGALVVQLGVAGADPGAVRLRGRVARVGRGLQLGDQAVLGGIDAGGAGLLSPVIGTAGIVVVAVSVVIGAAGSLELSAFLGHWCGGV